MTTSSLCSITMKFIRFVLVGLVLAAWGALPRSSYSAPSATTWYVAPGGSNSNACTSEQPCDHIQTAINLAASGDTINIAAGTYIEQLSIVDKNLTLKGEGAASTFLDVNQSFSILSIIASNVQNLTVNISGVTLQNGNPGSQAGAALVRRVKAHPAYTVAAGQLMGIEGPQDTTDLTTSKPTLTAKTQGGGIVEIAFNTFGPERVTRVLDKLTTPSAE